jgi:hypothetical protein
MFNDLYDAISLVWSWRRPVAEGEVTAVDIERMRQDRNSDTARLAVAYEFQLATTDHIQANASGCPHFAQSGE